MTKRIRCIARMTRRERRTYLMERGLLQQRVRAQKGWRAFKNCKLH